MSMRITSEVELIALLRPIAAFESEETKLHVIFENVKCIRSYIRMQSFPDDQELDGLVKDVDREAEAVQKKCIVSKMRMVNYNDCANRYEALCEALLEFFYNLNPKLVIPLECRL